MAIGLFCITDAIVASAPYRYDEGVYTSLVDERVHSPVRRVVEAVRYTGVIGFYVGWASAAMAGSSSVTVDPPTTST